MVQAAKIFQSLRSKYGYSFDWPKDLTKKYQSIPAKIILNYVNVPGEEIQVDTVQYLVP